MSPVAQGERADVRAETKDEKGRFVCLITGETTQSGHAGHVEPLTFSGKDAKRKWALHRSQIHGIKSARHEQIRKRRQRTEAKAKATTTTKRRSTGKRTTAKRNAATRIKAYRVEPAMLFHMEFEPMELTGAEIAEDGTLRLLRKGKVALTGRVGTPYVAVGNVSR